MGRAVVSAMETVVPQRRDFIMAKSDEPHATRRKLGHVRSRRRALVTLTFALEPLWLAQAAPGQARRKLQAPEAESLLLEGAELPIWSTRDLCEALREPHACVVAVLYERLLRDSMVRDVAVRLVTRAAAASVAGDSPRVVALRAASGAGAVGKLDGCSDDARFRFQRAAGLAAAGFIVAASGPRDRTCLLVSSPPEVRVTAAGANETDAEASWASLVLRANEHCNIDWDPVAVRETALGALRRRLEAEAHRPEVPEACEAVPAASMTEELFLRRFVARSRPVVIQGAAREWPAMRLWAQPGYMQERAGHRRVAFKAAPGGQFEGTEPVALWDPAGQQRPPPAVEEQLESPDKVVVRPQPMEADLGSFLTLLAHQVNASPCGEQPASPHPDREPDSARPSFYMEYLPMRGNLDELLEDLRVPDFASFLLEHSTNLWLGDGRTVGKLHFDPFENLLAVVSGAKHLTLYHPWRNEDLYEGHIREAELQLDNRTGKFRRITLQDTTAMVMSPVDIVDPDYARYPLFAHAVPVSCSAGPGDIMYVPAFHWHEVQSSPDDRCAGPGGTSISAAVNMWFRPFFDKEFPCRQCRPQLNRRDYVEVARRLLRPEGTGASMGSSGP